MTLETIWDKYINDDISTIHNEISELFSTPFTKKQLEEYDLREMTFDLVDYYEREKEYDKLLEFYHTLKQQQPEIYQKEFPYVEDVLLEHFCFNENKDEAKTSFSSFIQNPTQDYDIYLGSYYQLLFYQYEDIIKEAVTKNYLEVGHSKKLIGDSEFHLALGKFYSTLQFVYKGTQNIVDRVETQKVLKEYGFDIPDNPFLLLEKGIIEDSSSCDKIGNSPTIEESMLLQGAFLNYMYENKGINFLISGYIFHYLQEIFGNKYTRISEKTFSENLDDTSFKSGARSAVLIWGLVYFSEFLQEVNIISASDLTYFIKLSEKLKANFMGEHYRGLWKYDFIHRWANKPNSISEAEFEAESRIFKASYSFKGESFEEYKELIAEDLKALGTMSQGIINSARKFEKDINKWKGMISRFMEDDDEFETSTVSKTYDAEIRTDPKVGRNDPCPCGSGKKYKKCCGKS